jgi:hypothetical protein
MLVIEFLIYEQGSRTLSEAALKAREITYEDLFNEQGTCDGMIRISPEGNPGVQLEDELPALIKNLCFEANRELKETGQSIYYFNSYPGQINLTAADRIVKIEGNVMTTSFYEFGQFTEGLYNCGIRFIELIRNIKVLNEEVEKDRLSLIQILESAKKDMDNQTAL